MSLLDQLANPELVMGMSTPDKLSAGLQVTFLGMGITFVVLMFLWFAIVIMSRLINGNPVKAEKPVIVQKTVAASAPAAEQVVRQDDEELIAVITAAIAASMNTSMSNIIVRNITEFPTRQAAWSRAGIMEQIQSRY